MIDPDYEPKEGEHLPCCGDAVLKLSVDTTEFQRQLDEVKEELSLLSPFRKKDVAHGFLRALYGAAEEIIYALRSPLHKLTPQEHTILDYAVRTVEHGG